MKIREFKNRAGEILNNLNPTDEEKEKLVWIKSRDIYAPKRYQGIEVVTYAALPTKSFYIASKETLRLFKEMEDTYDYMNFTSSINES